MEDDAGKVVGASLMVWTGLYFASRALLPLSKTYSAWDRQRQYKARGLVPSSVFLMAIVPFSVLVLGWDKDLQHVRVSGATQWSQLICAVATGYFIYDSVVVLLHLRDDGLAYLVHGVLCMVRFPLSLCCLACVRVAALPACEGEGERWRNCGCATRAHVTRAHILLCCPCANILASCARAAACGLAVLR